MEANQVQDQVGMNGMSFSLLLCLSAAHIPQLLEIWDDDASKWALIGIIYITVFFFPLSLFFYFLGGFAYQA